jgi:hypothetical protein
MSKMKMKIMMLATVAAVAIPATMAVAASTTLHANAFFRAAITLTATAMNFSNVDFTAAPSAGTDFVRLGTNNAATYGGVFAAGAGAAPTAGDVTINTGTSGLVVDVSCDASGTLANAAGDSLISFTLEVDDAASTGAYGTGFACAGTGTPSTSLTLDGTDAFKFGAEIDGSTTAGAGAFGGAYSTTNTNGVPVTVVVNYQ